MTELEKKAWSTASKWRGFHLFHHYLTKQVLSKVKGIVGRAANPKDEFRRFWGDRAQISRESVGTHNWGDVCDFPLGSALS
jgi:hypothetical protein